MTTKFFLHNPDRYIGNIKDVMYSDKKMLHLFTICDRSRNVIKWSNERVGIHFLNPKTKDMDVFFPDLMIKYIHDGKEVTEVLDIRSVGETGSETGKSHSIAMKDPVNNAKWESAKSLCEKNGIVFRVVSDVFKYKIPRNFAKGDTKR